MRYALVDARTETVTLTDDVTDMELDDWYYVLPEPDEQGRVQIPVEAFKDAQRAVDVLENTGWDPCEHWLVAQ